MRTGTKCGTLTAGTDDVDEFDLDSAAEVVPVNLDSGGVVSWTNREVASIRTDVRYVAAR